MGADIGAKTVQGGTALWWARQLENVDIVRYLEDIGAPDDGEGI